jgi:RNA polymerase sigma factor (sigma-70 family)
MADLYGGTSSEDLVNRLAAGDTTAMGPLVERYGPLVGAAARRVVRSAADVEDVVQETWLALSVNAGRIRHPDRVAAWLWSTATNAATHLAVRNHRFEPCDPDQLHFDEADLNAADPLRSALDGERRVAVREALAAVTAEERELLALLLGDRTVSYRRVGELLGRPVGSLGPTRGRILAKLRATPSVHRLLDPPRARVRPVKLPDVLAVPKPADLVAH